MHSTKCFPACGRRIPSIGYNTNGESFERNSLEVCTTAKYLSQARLEEATKSPFCFSVWRHWCYLWCGTWQAALSLTDREAWQTSRQQKTPVAHWWSALYRRVTHWSIVLVYSLEEWSRKILEHDALAACLSLLPGRGLPCSLRECSMVRTLANLLSAINYSLA